MKRLKKSQRLRVIANGVSFYTTVGQIEDGVGDQTKTNRVLRYVLDELNRCRRSDPAVGMCGRWEDMDVQMSMV